tara:strand:+ start:2040 stop:2519 length:480 start_codon:yes stop_codon:yes gene_type:complete
MGFYSDLKIRVGEVGWTSGTVLREFMRFNVTGCFNTAFSFTLYQILYWANIWDAHTAVSAWVVSNIIGNVEAHYMHYKFTFDSSFAYKASLNRAFWCYTGQLVVTTALEFLMIEIWLINHNIAWLINTCVFGFLNFVLIRWLAFPPDLDHSYLGRLADC